MSVCLIICGYYILAQCIDVPNEKLWRGRLGLDGAVYHHPAPGASGNIRYVEDVLSYLLYLPEVTLSTESGGIHSFQRVLYYTLILNVCLL